MTPRLRTSMTLLVVSILAALSFIAGIGWFIPQLHTLRSRIDNDRASASLIVQQQSNLDKLRQDIDSITEKQKSLDANVWPFLTEDDFYAFFDTLAQGRHVTVDAPGISDATPTGKLLSRSVTVTIRGSLSNVLAAVDDMQRHTPLIAIQQLGLKGTSSADVVRLTVTATTLWK